uniref:protein-L-isoaspartate(D-aspartate) O-methyltransferase n=1 Tax=Trichobilharzia regenti TaxID=157069 RepID=A0AA85IYV0_TRIRE|nr:unnamed protein product [Trichobilharzia regenti]
MIAITFMKYFLVSLTILHLLGAVSASSPDFTTQGELVDYLSNEGFIKSLAVKEAMILVDRRFFVNHNPYKDSPQAVEHESTAAAPRVHARILEGLKDHMTEGSSVSCVLCDTGYLLACMALFVTVRGAVIGVQMKYPLTMLNYDKFERWIEHTGSVKLLGYQKDKPFLLYSRDQTTDDVPGTNISAIYYHGNDENTLRVLEGRLRAGGRLIYEKTSGSGDPELMVVDKLQNGSLNKRTLTEVLKESAKKEEEAEVEEGKEEEGEEEELGGLDDLFPPQPAPPGLPDRDELLLISSQIKCIPDVKVLLLLVCIAVISCILLL